MSRGKRERERENKISTLITSRRTLTAQFEKRNPGLSVFSESICVLCKTYKVHNDLNKLDLKPCMESGVKWLHLSVSCEQSDFIFLNYFTGIN